MLNNIHYEVYGTFSVVQNMQMLLLSNKFCPILQHDDIVKEIHFLFRFSLVAKMRAVFLYGTIVFTLLLLQLYDEW